MARRKGVCVKVMMVSSWEEKCGVAEYTRALKKELDALVDVQAFPIPPMKHRKGLGRIAEEINKGDVAHIQYHPDFFGFWKYPGTIHAFLFFLKQIRIPSVITVHDLTHRLPFLKMNDISLKRLVYNLATVPLVNRSTYGRFLLGRFLNVADHLIVHTTTTKAFLQSAGIDPKKISVAYPGIPDLDLQDQNTAREQFGWKDRKIMTVFGFIIPSKGYETVLKAMKHLPSNIVLLIAGGVRREFYRPYFEALKADIVSSGLGDRVRITGHLEDEKIVAALCASDIILLPYQQDAFLTGTSYALSYAMASKRPVITSDTVYFSDIARRCSAFTTFKNGNSEELARAITKVLDSGGKEGVGAREYRQTWTWRNVAERTNRLYCELLEKRPQISPY